MAQYEAQLQSTRGLHQNTPTAMSVKAVCRKILLHIAVLMAVRKEHLKNRQKQQRWAGANDLHFNTVLSGPFSNGVRERILTQRWTTFLFYRYNFVPYALPTVSAACQCGWLLIYWYRWSSSQLSTQSCNNQTCNRPVRWTNSGSLCQAIGNLTSKSFTQ